MDKVTLHITNGSSLTHYLKELDISGDYLTWQEMLCEGPTTTLINSEEFLIKRKTFLNDFYHIELNETEFKEEIAILNNVDSYSEIVLWFEYDLFCHINMLGVIKLLNEKQVPLPIYLVCSGRIKGKTQLKGLSELTPEQLFQHYKEKIKLKDSDLELAISIWHIYNGKDHNLLKPFITQKSSFKYLSNCLKAHLTRFPNLKSGLSTLEENILTIIKEKNVKSKNQLMGYVLNYQGYYGFGDMQILRLIDILQIFYTEEENKISLNRKGYEALTGNHNFSFQINNNLTFGGLNRLDFSYDGQTNKLIKTPLNVN
ncbi:DUF1835 domain-containing protein [Xanthomarina sp. F2636L]|uniref:DUF1835 domain-containing protein n=1 Tax=Xanthomarina sp. F2636L TaxID=2996018 RepID=UPI00225E2C8C|nr:DUF1835 domain-containing protein [Xanthomarina sp. F2636L]MCX7549691.1 DUF1835 domain-containing protein [Xanthomarina sp. F2636L]